MTGIFCLNSFPTIVAILLTCTRRQENHHLHMFEFQLQNFYKSKKLSNLDNICAMICQWTDCIIDTIFKNIKKVKIITTALKSILNLVKLQILVAKCCKM